MATKYITLDNLTVFLENLQSSTEKKFVATADIFGGIRTGFSGRSNNYAVQLNDDGKAYVNVPWENTTYTASDGLIINNSTINLNFDNTQHNYTPITIGSQVKDRHYAVQLDKNGKIAVYVPHTDTKVSQSSKHYKPNNASQSKSLGIYKYSVDAAGHLYNISATTADDIIKICPELKKTQDVIQVAKEISWSDLKSAKDNGNLVPGRQYRIIDYTTKIYDDGFWATAGHDFDVIVEATSNNELSEFAKAASRAGDTYFSGCNLSAWELKYCIDNNDNRFEMIADTQNGKGVIYYMKDERNNEAPCDFKNVLYKINNKNYYIFSCYNTDNNQIFDASVKGLPRWPSGKKSACQCMRHRRSLGGEYLLEEEISNSLQYSCLENPMDTGTWRASVQEVAKSQSQLSTHALFPSVKMLTLDQKVTRGRRKGESNLKVE